MAARKAASKIAGWIVAGLLCAAVLVGAINFIKARNSPASNACVNNLRQLEAAKVQWRLENGKQGTNKVGWEELKPYLKRNEGDTLGWMHCPDDETKSFSNSYTLGNLQTKAECRVNPKHNIE